MVEANIRQEVRLKKIDKTTNYFIEGIKKNDLMSQKHKNVCKVLHYIEYLLILASKVTGCVSISAFASLHSYWNYEFCYKIKNLCNNCRN